MGEFFTKLIRLEKLPNTKPHTENDLFFCKKPLNCLPDVIVFVTLKRKASLLFFGNLGHEYICSHLIKSTMYLAENLFIQLSVLEGYACALYTQRSTHTVGQPTQ